MKLLYKYGMFPYEPEKRDKYLESLEGRHVKIIIERRKRPIKGIILGLTYGMLSNELVILQKKQKVYVPVNIINKIYETGK